MVFKIQRDLSGSVSLYSETERIAGRSTLRSRRVHSREYRKNSLPSLKYVKSSGVRLEMIFFNHEICVCALLAAISFRRKKQRRNEDKDEYYHKRTRKRNYTFYRHDDGGLCRSAAAGKGQRLLRGAKFCSHGHFYGKYDPAIRSKRHLSLR